MKRIGIFGGTFDPIHNAHVILAQRAREECQLSEVRVIPTGDPAHREHAPLFPARLRAELARLAFDGLTGFVVDDREIRRTGPSYTLFTIEELEREHPGAELYFFCGADSVASLPTWYRAEELARKVTFVALPRDGTDRTSITVPPGFEVRWVEDAPIGISSTIVRARLESGLTLRGYLPETVVTRLARFATTGL